MGSQPRMETSCQSLEVVLRKKLEFEEFAEAFGLGAADGDFGLFFVVHF